MTGSTPAPTRACGATRSWQSCGLDSNCSAIASRQASAGPTRCDGQSSSDQGAEVVTYEVDAVHDELGILWWRLRQAVVR